MTDKTMSRRELLRNIGRGGLLLGAGAVLPSVVAACGSSPASTPRGTTATKTPLALAMGYLAAPSFGLFDVGVTKGWFHSGGVDLALTLFTSGPPMLQAMAGGSTQSGMLGTIPPLVTAAQGAFPIKIISVVEDASGLYSIIAGPSIKTVADLKGKKVAAAVGTDFQYLLDLALQKYGMTESDIHLVDLQQADAQSAFIAGQVDAVLPAAVNRALIQQKVAGSHVVFQPSDFPKPPNPMPALRLFDLLVAPASAVTSHKEALVRALQVYHGKIVPYVTSASTRPAAIADLLAWQNSVVKSPTTSTLLQAQLGGYTFYDVSAVKALMHGSELSSSLTDQAQFLLRGGQLHSTPKVSDLIDTSIVDRLT